MDGEKELREDGEGNESTNVKRLDIHLWSRCKLPKKQRGAILEKNNEEENYVISLYIYYRKQSDI